MNNSATKQIATEVAERSEESAIDSLEAGINQKNGRADHQKIAEIAFSLWQERGCPYGSPEQDWYQAERMAGNCAEGDAQ